MQHNRFNRRILVALSLVAATSAALAQSQAPNCSYSAQEHQAKNSQKANESLQSQENFKQKQQAEFGRLEKREAIIKNYRACVISSTDYASLKACEEAAETEKHDPHHGHGSF